MTHASFIDVLLSKGWTLASGNHGADHAARRLLAVLPAISRWSVRAALTVVFGYCLYLHLQYAFVGWDHPLAELHQWRQSHTALSVYYLLKDGLRLDYPAPLFGYPWSVPLECPLYQWVVAIVVGLFGTPLEPTGRAVSLAFFYAGLIPAYHLLGLLIRNRYVRLIPLALVLVDPIYLYWSRTFLIESTVQCLSLAFLSLLAVAQKTHRRSIMVATVLVGGVAGAVKVTTFAVYLVLAAAMVVWSSYLRWRWHRHVWPVLLALVRGGILLGGPVAITLLWTAYADQVKEAHPLAHGMTSRSMMSWNLGTWEQRFADGNWQRIDEFSHVTGHFGGISLNHLTPESFLFACVIVIALLYHRTRRWHILLMFTAFLSGPLVFMNLYVRHDYYHYATSLFGAAGFGMAIVALLESERREVRWLVGCVVLPLALRSFLSDYENGIYLASQRNVRQTFPELTAAVRAHTTEKELVYITNGDWDPTFAYNFERRVIMDNGRMKLTDPGLLQELEVLETAGYRIGAFLYNQGDVGPFAEERVRFFGLNPTPSFEDGAVRLHTLH